MNKVLLNLINKIENKSTNVLRKYILGSICAGISMYVIFLKCDYKVSYSTKINLNELAVCIIGIIIIMGSFSLIRVSRNKQIIFLFGSICALFLSLGIILFTYGMLYEITNSKYISDIYKYCSLSILILILSCLHVKITLHKKIEDNGYSTKAPAIASILGITGTFIIKRVMNNLSDKNEAVLEIALFDVVLLFTIYCIPFFLIHYIISKKLRGGEKFVSLNDIYY